LSDWRIEMKIGGIVEGDIRRGKSEVVEVMEI
jgi:hypothetical protein